MLAIIGFLCWASGVLIWVGSASAIHEILAAVIVLNGTVLVAANQITSYLSSCIEAIRSSGPKADPWKDMSSKPSGNSLLGS